MHQPGFTRFVEYAPGKVVANHDLPVSFDNITERTGIQSRNFADPDETVESMALAVARKFFAEMGITAKQCSGLVLGSTAEETGVLQQTAIRAAKRLEIHGTADATNFACSGFPAAAAIARNRCLAQSQHILLITVEMLSRIVDFRDETTAILFGDRACATTVHPYGPLQIMEAWATPLPDEENLITLQNVNGAVDCRGNAGPRIVAVLKGKELYKLVPNRMLDLAVDPDMVQKHGRATKIVHHQANGKFGQKIRKLLEKEGISDTQVFDHIGGMGNVGACSIPCTLAKIQDQLDPEALVACPTVGAGRDLRTGELTEGVVLFRKRLAMRQAA